MLRDSARDVGVEFECSRHREILASGVAPLSSSSPSRETGHLTLFYSILHSRLKDVFRWPGSLLQTLHVILLNFLVPFTVFFNIPFLSGDLGGPHRFGVRLRLCPLSMWLCFLRQTIKIIEILYIVVVYFIAWLRYESNYMYGIGSYL